MILSFPWPYSQGEWLAWSAAVFTVLLGLALFLFPRAGLRALGIRHMPENAALVGAVRSLLGGFHLGLGLSAILLAQPFIYLALGIAWAFATLGRLLSLVADQNTTISGWIGLAASMFLATLPLAYVLGFIP